MASDQTRPSLLARIRNAQDEGSWREFTAIYTPVIRAYAGRCGVPGQEMDDLVQEALWAVSQLIERFEHDPANRRFRPWLWSITHRRILKWRSGQRRAPIQPEDSLILKAVTGHDHALEQYWDEQWTQQVMARAAETVREQVAPRTFEVFRRYVVLQQPAAEVAQALGTTISNVYACKYRVMTRLRQEVEAMDG